MPSLPAAVNSSRDRFLNYLNLFCVPYEVSFRGRSPNFFPKRLTPRSSSLFFLLAGGFLSRRFRLRLGCFLALSWSSAGFSTRFDFGSLRFLWLLFQSRS